MCSPLIGILKHIPCQLADVCLAMYLATFKFSTKAFNGIVQSLVEASNTYSTYMIQSYESKQDFVEKFNLLCEYEEILEKEILVCSDIFKQQWIQNCYSSVRTWLSAKIEELNTARHITRTYEHYITKPSSSKSSASIQ